MLVTEMAIRVFAQPRAEGADDDDREQDVGKGEHHVDQAHHQPSNHHHGSR